MIQYIYGRYGRDRAGLAATVISYRGRSAVREVGKALGLSEDTVAALATTIWGLSNSGMTETYVRQAGLDPTDPLLARCLELTQELIGFPRHLSQHVGGFVLTRGPLSEVVPIGNAAMEDRTVIEWDKDDLDALGPAESRCARPRHAHLHPQGLRAAESALRPRALARHRAPRRSGTSTTCCAGRIRSACSRSRAGRR